MAEGYEGYQGYGGYGAGADPAAMRSKLAMAMMAQGADSSPVHSKWQGAARLSQALFGALIARQNQSAYSDSWKKALGAMPSGTAAGGLVGALTGGAGDPGLPAQPGALADLANDPDIMRGVINASGNGLPDTATIGESLARGASPPSMGPPIPPNAAGGVNPGGPMPGGALPAGGAGGGVGSGSMVGSLGLPPQGIQVASNDPTFVPHPQSGNAARGGGGPAAFNPGDLAMLQQDMQAVPGAAAPQRGGGGPLGGPLGLVAQAESGNQNIPQRIHDINTDKGTPAQGNFQIIDPTWQRYAPAAGVDPRQYPSAITAPLDLQTRVASAIPVNQWGPNTVRALKAQYPGININGTLGEAQAQFGGQGGQSSAPPSALAFGGNGAPPNGPALAAIQGSAPPPNGLPASMQPNMMVAGPGVPSGARGGNPNPPSGGNPPPSFGGNPLDSLGSGLSSIFGIGNPSSPQGDNAPAPAGTGASGGVNDPRMRQLMEVLSDPYAAPGAKALAGEFLKYYMPHPFSYQAVPGTNDERQMDWMMRPTGTVIHGGPKEQKLSGGETIYEGDSSGNNYKPVAGWGAQNGGGGQPVGGAPAAAAGPSSQPLPNESYESYKSRMEAMGKNQGALAVPTTEDYAKITQGARGDESYKEADLSTNAYNGMTRASTLDTHAADKTMIDSFNQIMNPNTRSGVGMFNINQDLQSFPDELRGEIVKAWNGQGKLSPQTRAAMLTDSRIRVEAYRSSWDAARGGWLSTAKHGNVDPTAVPNLIQPIEPDWNSISRYGVDADGNIIDKRANGARVLHSTLETTPGQPQPGVTPESAPSGGAKVPTVTDQAGYDALFKGDSYIGPNGQPMVKRTGKERPQN